MERAIAFSNHAGQTLHGVLHMPEPRAHTTLGVMLLSPGQKCRLGPWRSYVRLARRLARQGVPVLRFDFHGLGDSEGSHEHGQYLVDFNGFVQTGGLTDDVVAAAQFFTREAGATHFVFAGLCGGAATGLLAATRVPGVYGHVLVDLPVTISSSARQRYLERHPEEILKLRPEESHGVLRDYVTRATDPRAWVRLLSGRSNLRLLAEAARHAALGTLARARTRVLGEPADRTRTRTPPATEPAPAVEAGATEEPNLPTIEAFEAARARGQRIFFLNSSAYHPTFEQYFGRRYLPAERAEWHGLGLLVVPETNHIFSAEHSQTALFEAVEEFVRNALADLAERPSASALSPSLSAPPPR